MKKGLLFAIVVLAIALRFFQLGSIPPEMTWDEVAWGYNAFALGIDGKDEFGKFLPISYIESFGDFKPPVYAYLSVLPVKIFGLSAFSIRFASAFFGALTVIVTYFLTKEIFSKKKAFSKNTSDYLNINHVSLGAAFMLAVSPWHINLSRAAFEANIASLFLAGGVWLFLRWVRNGAFWSILCSGLLFVLSLYTFNTSRIVAPLIVVMLSIGFIKVLWKRKKAVILAGVVCMALSAPFLRFVITPQAQLRFHEVNIFSDASIVEQSNDAMEVSRNYWCGDRSECSIPLYAKAIHNRRVAYGISYLKHYFDHFNPSFLFIRGDGNPKFSTQDVGTFYLWSAPFLIAGALLLFRKRWGYWWIAPLWLVIGIIPAATARETPHALRIATTIPTWQIMIAVGMAWGYAQLRSWRGVAKHSLIVRVTVAVVALVLIGNISYYLHGYYIHYPREYSGIWQYGYEEAIAYVQEHTEFETVSMTNAMGRPYAYVLFYSQINPEEFRRSAAIEREAYGFVHVHGFGRYVFSESPDSIEATGRVLIIDKPSRLSEGVKILKEFKKLDGEVALVAYEK